MKALYTKLLHNVKCIVVIYYNVTTIVNSGLLIYPTRAYHTASTYMLQLIDIAKNKDFIFIVLSL